MNLVATLLYFIAASSLLGLALGFQHGALDPRVAWLALAGGALVAGGVCRAGRKFNDRLERPRGWGWVPVVLFTLFAVRAFLWLIFSGADGGHGKNNRDLLLVLSPNNLGDLSLHLTLINYFANGAPLWPDSPIFSNGKLAYTAGADFFNSLLVLAGLDVERGLILTGLVCALLAGFALWRWGGPITLMAFLAHGSLLGFACFFSGRNEPLFRDYSGNLVFDWAWKNPALALLVTQRGFLFALPAGLLLLSSWRTRFFLDGRGWRLPFAGELLLYAAMPFFHVHTFIALSFFLACFFIVRAAARWPIVKLAGAAFVPATVLLYFTIGMFQANAEPMWTDMGKFDHPPARPPAQTLGWQPGWEVNDRPTFEAWVEFTSGRASPFESHGRFLFFWLGNFGLWPFLAGSLVLLLLRMMLGKNIRAQWAWVAALAILAVTPMLGWMTGYQTESFSHWLPGSGDGSLWRIIALPVLATAAAIGGAMLHLRNARDFGARWLLFAFVGCYVLDALLPFFGAPPLRADAIPLVLATMGFGALLFRLARQRETDCTPAAFAFPALFLFFVCCNVMFAPWAWDNTKLMLWAYLALAPFVWELVLARWQQWTRAPAIFVLFFPGTVTLLGGINSQHHGYEIAHRSELDAVRAAVRSIPITEAFAAEPAYNHPLLLNGRKLVLGYIGHLQSHGILYREQERRLDSLMNGEDDWRLAAAELRVRYLFWGGREQQLWRESRESWRAGATRIAAGEWGELFDLDIPPLPLPE